VSALQGKAHAAWLASLKVGDVAVARGGYANEKCLVTIDAIQKLHFVAGKLKFRRADGFEAGTGWTRLHLTGPATAEDRAEIRLANARAFLGRFTGWKNLPAETVIEVSRLVREAENKEAARAAEEGT
jgi:hypothetical protein